VTEIAASKLPAIHPIEEYVLKSDGLTAYDTYPRKLHERAADSPDGAFCCGRLNQTAA
jgi:hypothetical protein